jgi:hypothetical protein
MVICSFRVYAHRHMVQEFTYVVSDYVELHVSGGNPSVNRGSTKKILQFVNI